MPALPLKTIAIALTAALVPAAAQPPPRMKPAYLVRQEIHAASRTAFENAVANGCTSPMSYGERGLIRASRSGATRPVRASANRTIRRIRACLGPSIRRRASSRSTRRCLRAPACGAISGQKSFDAAAPGVGAG